MPETLDDIVTRTSELLAERDVAALSTLMAGLSTTNAVRMLERVDSAQRAVLFRLLPKDEAVVVFDCGIGQKYPPPPGLGTAAG